MDNYYVNQIKEYNTSYNVAIDKIDSIIKLMNQLFLSFAGAKGNDVILIRSEINAFIKKLEAIKKIISKAKESTNTKASNSDTVYTKIKELQPTPTFKSKDNAYESTGEKRVFIENGIIYWEEKFRQIPLSAYDGLFGGIAAVGKLFNSYPVIVSRTYADIDSMFNGIVKMKPFIS